MTSLQTSIKQVPTQGGNFVTLGNVTVVSYVADANGVTGSFATGFTVGSNKFLRDEGRTIVSSGVTFRKVQLISTMGAGGAYGYSNAGVAGSVPSGNDATGYLTGYIQLANNGGAGAFVARV